jgi:hypothetical protein
MNETFSPPEVPPPRPAAPAGSCRPQLLPRGLPQSLQRCADHDAAAANENLSRPAGTELSHRDMSEDSPSRDLKEGGEQIFRQPTSTETPSLAQQSE